MATNFLMFYRAGITDDMAFLVGVSGVECVVGERRIYTKSLAGKGKLGS